MIRLALHFASARHARYASSAAAHGSDRATTIPPQTRRES